MYPFGSLYYQSTQTVYLNTCKYQSKLKESDSKLASVDSTISELQSKVDLLEASTSRDTDIEEIYSKLSVVQANYDNSDSLCTQSVFKK